MQQQFSNNFLNIIQNQANLININVSYINVDERRDTAKLKGISSPERSIKS